MSEPTAPIDQAPEQSMEDRIAGKFGLNEDQPSEGFDGQRMEEAPEEEVEAAPEPEEVEVEYDGAKYRVPKGLEKAILQERDYTQKSQQLAEQRRQVEYAQKAQEASRIEREFTESVAQELQQVNLLDNYLQQLKGVNINDLPMEDGFKHWMQLQQLKEQRDTLHKSIEGKRAEYTAKQRAHLESLKSEARNLLSKQITGYNDEVAAQLSAHAKSLGYTEADAEMIQLDPRASSLLYKAMKYDQLQATKAEVVQKATTPVVKPGSSNPMPQAVRDKLAFKKAMKSATSSKDKARLIEQRLTNSF
jgi:small-conductance mechanosensitive channel